MHDYITVPHGMGHSISVQFRRRGGHLFAAGIEKFVEGEFNSWPEDTQGVVRRGGRARDVFAVVHGCGQRGDANRRAEGPKSLENKEGNLRVAIVAYGRGRVFTGRGRQVPVVEGVVTCDGVVV